MGKHYNFLQYVKQYVEENPDVTPHVTEFVSLGLKGSIDKLKEQKLNTEIALTFALERKQKGSNVFLRQKLEEVNKNSGLDYSSYIAKLKD